MSNRKIDHNGKRYGRLTVVRELDSRSRKSIMWELRCQCGNLVHRSSADIVKGNKLEVEQSCGCVRDIELEMNTVYGYLTPLRRLDKKSDLGYEWEFSCKCGNKIKRIGSHVKRGQGALHCGCIKIQGGNNKNDLSGCQFGKLRVLEQTGVTPSQQSKWKCECECGNQIETLGFYLRRGKTHCGCDTPRGDMNKSFKGYGEIYRSHWSNIESGAIKRRITFNLTIEEAWKLFLTQERRCALSRQILHMGASGKRTASLDRIDSAQGYSIDNVQWVHKDINVAKWSMTNEQFINMCGDVWRTHGVGTSHR